MDRFLTKLFKTIDNTDADENIKLFYKELLLFEFENKPVIYKDKYKELIKFYMEDI